MNAPGPCCGRVSVLWVGKVPGLGRSHLHLFTCTRCGRCWVTRKEES